MPFDGHASPLQQVAERVVAHYLVHAGMDEVQIVSPFDVYRARGISLVANAPDGERHTYKVKADPYFGADPAKIAQRSLPFYRAETQMLSFEEIADAESREPGWIVGSDADELLYYLLAVAQEEDEVEALLAERDEIFLSEIRIERDELLALPMHALQEWFSHAADGYPPRPVVRAGNASWHRLVPRKDVQTNVAGVRLIGPVFSGVSY
jgi:hypothetical protein